MSRHRHAINQSKQHHVNYSAGAWRGHTLWWACIVTASNTAHILGLLELCEGRVGAFVRKRMHKIVIKPPVLLDLLHSPPVVLLRDAIAYPLRPFFCPASSVILLVLVLLSLSPPPPPVLPFLSSSLFSLSFPLLFLLLFFSRTAPLTPPFPLVSPFLSLSLCFNPFPSTCSSFP